jgi:hypothetical protein
MGAVEAQHAGVASGINNAVSRIAGLLAVAVVGVVLVHTFDAHVKTSLDGLGLTTSIRTEIDRELPRMAGADVAALSTDSSTRAGVRAVIAAAFVAAFRVVLTGAGAVALVAAVFGALVREPERA